MTVVFPDSRHVIAAGADVELLARFRALAPSVGFAPGEVDAVFSQLVLSPVDVESDVTVAAVWGAAADRRARLVEALPPVPGADPAVVTDQMILHALAAYKDRPVPESPVEPPPPVMPVSTYYSMPEGAAEAVALSGPEGLVEAPMV